MSCLCIRTRFALIERNFCTFSTISMAFWHIYFKSIEFTRANRLNIYFHSCFHVAIARPFGVSFSCKWSLVLFVKFVSPFISPEKYFPSTFCSWRKSNTTYPWHVYNVRLLLPWHGWTVCAPVAYSSLSLRVWWCCVRVCVCVCATMWDITKYFTSNLISVQRHSH